MDLGVMGRFNDRFSSYGKAHDLAGKFAAVARVEGLEGLELVYPFDFADDVETKRLLAHYNLAVSSVNVNLKAEEKFHLGSLTRRDPGIRREAVYYIKNAMDIAARLGCNLITMCPIADGFDYLFQSDYLQAWNWFLDGIGEAARHRTDVRASLEYKVNEPRSHVILPNMGVSLLVCLKVGIPNVGVTMDMGHAMLVYESPAASVAILAEANRLFLVHVDDNYREWDWDMIPGSVNPWDLIEMMFYLKHLDYDGWLVSDVVPFRLDPVKVCSATYRNLVWADKVVERIGMERLWKFIREGNPIDAMTAIQETLIS